MAIPFLNNIDLTNNQLLNAKLQVTGTQPQSAPGQIYFDSSLDTALYHDNNNWVRLRDTTLTSGTFVSAAGVSSGGTLNYTVDLSATGTPDATKYLRGDNAWEPITAIPGTYEWEIEGDSGGPETVASGDVVTFVGGTNVSTVLVGTTLTINSTDQFVGTLTGIGAGDYISIDNSTPAVPIVNALGTEAATPSKLIARDSSGYGYVVTPASGDSTTKIATTAFVQSSLTGLLEFKGGFDASTGAIVGGGNLTSGGTRVAIAVGDYYVVTVAGDFFGNTATPLTPGDSVIVQTAAAAGASVEGDFIVVQSDTDLATLTTVGIGNVNAADSPAVPDPGLDGLSVTYSSGTAIVGLDINSLAAVTTTEDDSSIAIYDNAIGANKKIELGDLAPVLNGFTSFSGLIGDGALTSLPITSGTHGLGADSTSFMIQLVEVSSGETVYADVVRGASGLVTIVFAVAPALNSIRVLIQKIG